MDDPPDPLSNIRIVESVPGRIGGSRLVKAIDVTGRSARSIWIRELGSGNLNLTFERYLDGDWRIAHELFSSASALAQVQTDTGLVHVGHDCPEFALDRAHAHVAGYVELEPTHIEQLQRAGYRELPPAGTLVLYPLDPMPVCLRALELYDRGCVEIGAFRLEAVRKLLRIYGECGVPPHNLRPPGYTFH